MSLLSDGYRALNDLRRAGLSLDALEVVATPATLRAALWEACEWGYIPSPDQPVRLFGLRVLESSFAPEGRLLVRRRQPPSWGELAEGYIAATPTRAEAASVEHVEALVGLARSGREQDFRDLAAMVGVPKEQHDALWEGTCARLPERGERPK